MPTLNFVTKMVSKCNYRNGQNMQVILINNIAFINVFQQFSTSHKWKIFGVRRT